MKFVMSCDAKKFGSGYKEYANACRKEGGGLANFSMEMCGLSPDTMGGMRKLQKTSNQMPRMLNTTQSFGLSDLPDKVEFKNIPKCFAKSCDKESKKMTAGIMKYFLKSMGMSCPREKGKTKFALRVTKKNKVTKMSCKKLSRGNSDLKKKICFHPEHQLYPGDFLPASQACPLTCKSDFSNYVEEDPNGEAKFSIMEDDGSGTLERIMTCGELKKKTRENNPMAAMEAMEICFQGYKMFKGKKKYGDAIEVCRTTCSELMGMGGDV